MKMSTKSLLFASGCAIALASLAHAQDRKPLPPEPVQSEPASERLANMGQFLDAYRRAGSPRMLIVTSGLDGFGDVMGSRLEDLFRDSEVTIVNPQANTLKQQRDRDALTRNDEYAAARMAGADAGADVVVTVDVREHGRGCYKGSYTLVDLRQGTTLGRFAWDMIPDEDSGRFDNYRMSEYARAIGGRVSRQFIEAYPLGPGGGAMKRYSLKLVGEYEDEDVVAFRDALNNAEGIRQGSVTLRAQEQSSADQLTSFTLMSACDTLSLRSNVSRAIADQLAMSAEVLDARESSLTVRLSELGMSQRERALSGGSETSRNRSEREALRTNYTKAGSPTIAVMINRASATVTSSVSQGSNLTELGDGTNIIVGDRVDFGSGQLDPVLGDAIRDELTDRRVDRAEQAEVDLRQIENRMVSRLTALGLRLKDVSSAQAEMRAKDELSKDWTDRELASVLGKNSGADVVLSGVARVVRTRSSRAWPVRIEVTVRAYRTSDGVILGSASSQKDVASAGATLDQALDDLAAQATGRLASQLSDSWK